MHPAAAIVLWLLATLACQLAAPLRLLALVPVVAVLAGTAWWRFVRRARWLLLSLWLILAYSLPGDALLDLTWMPTWAGVDAANVHALRLLLTLGILALLLGRVPRDELLFGLWCLIRPAGAAAERLVVRLALVLAALEQVPARREWLALLGESQAEAGSEAPVRLHCRVWVSRDTVKLTLFSTLLAALVWA